MSENQATSTVFITGVSSGLGHGLAAAYLQRNCRVLGTSRRVPADLQAAERFRFQSLDLRDSAQVSVVVGELLRGIEIVDLAILNAGIMGPFGDMLDVEVEPLKEVMHVNLWANKLLLDALLCSPVHVCQVVTISSGASVNGNRGWSGYAISKAALNMLTKLYAAENPDTHFCALAPGLIDTAMQDQLCARPHDARYPSLEVLRSKRNTLEMPGPDEAAARLLQAIAKLPRLVASGEYADLRDL